MSRNRLGQVLLATAVALTIAGCTAAGQTEPPSSSPAASAARSVAPTAVPSPTPTPTPGRSASPASSAGDAALAARAIEIVRALGGTIPPAGAILRSPAPLAPGTYFTIGDWSVGWEATGRLVAVAVAPSTPGPRPGAPLSGSDARVRVADYLTRLGVTLGGPDLFYQDPEMSWRAHWNRKIDGVPAPQDGTLMTIASDGTFMSYRYLETGTAPAPATTISQAQALAKFPTCKNSTGGANGKVETCSAKLEWHANQATQGAPLRLCWRIDYAWHDNAGIEGASALWVDAGTGETVEFTTTA